MNQGWRAHALLTVAVAGVFVSPAVAQTSYVRLREIRFWSLADVTRVAIETSAEVEYRSERVESPDRIFFDLQQARPRVGRRGIEIFPVNDALLKQIRVAETQPGVVRIVFDLAGPVEYSVSELRNPTRLIVEFRKPAVVPQVPAAIPEPPKPEPQPPADLPAPPPIQTSSLPASSGPRALGSGALPPPKPVAAKPAAAKPVAAKKDSRGEYSLIRALGLKLTRVVLDPGHGGHDTGTIGPTGYMEKDLVLDVAKRLAALISERLGSDVVLTRTDDTFVPLEGRTQFAIEREADLFLSIHANSSSATRIAGPETFYLNFTTDEGALEVAARENASGGRSIKDYPNLVQKIALYEKVHESRELAERVQQSLYTTLARPRGVRNRGVKKAPFVVLIGAQIPSVLAEIAFLSNPRDEALLKRPDYRQKTAEALFRGLYRYASGFAQQKTAAADIRPASAR